jgi:uncharacterized protein (DUF433 family)
MIEIDWTNCPDVESVPGRCSGAWVVKDSRVMVESCLFENFEAGETPRSIARMFGLPVATVRRVLHFGLMAELDALAERHAGWSRADAARYRKLGRQAGSIEATMRRLRQHTVTLPLDPYLVRGEGKATGRFIGFSRPRHSST